MFSLVGVARRKFLAWREPIYLLRNKALRSSSRTLAVHTHTYTCTYPFISLLCILYHIRVYVRTPNSPLSRSVSCATRHTHLLTRLAKWGARMIMRKRSVFFSFFFPRSSPSHNQVVLSVGFYSPRVRKKVEGKMTHTIRCWEGREDDSRKGGIGCG